MTDRALLVGINAYPGSPLQGCLQDVETMRSILRQTPTFQPEATVLRDAEATTRAIREGLAWLTHDLRPGDRALWHYSGHGAQVKDRSGDERDGWDEVICPVDFDWSPERMLRDDDVSAWLATVAPGVRVTIVLDSCHAGTMQRDLRRGVRRLMAPSGSTVLQEVSAWRRWLGWGPRIARFGRRAVREAQPEVVLIAATRPTELAADAWIDGKAQGAHTAALAVCLRRGWQVPLREVVRQMRFWLRQRRYDQTPTLYGNRRPRGRAWLGQ